MKKQSETKEVRRGLSVFDSCCTTAYAGKAPYTFSSERKSGSGPPSCFSKSPKKTEMKKCRKIAKQKQLKHRNDCSSDLNLHHGG